mgnify:CR=1 FL=1
MKDYRLCRQSQLSFYWQLFCVSILSIDLLYSEEPNAKIIIKIRLSMIKPIAKAIPIPKDFDSFTQSPILMIEGTNTKNINTQKTKKSLSGNMAPREIHDIRPNI